MTPEDLNTLLDGTGLPTSYRQWKQPPVPPYLVYLFAYSSDHMADDCNYAEVSNWQVELYTKVKDPGSEGAVETVLKEASIPYQKVETFLDTEDLYQILYLIRTK